MMNGWHKRRRYSWGGEEGGLHGNRRGGERELLFPRFDCTFVHQEKR